MRAGFAQVDITPAPGEEMTGYGYYLNRRAKGTMDPLMARALAIEEGGAAAVIVQLDLLALPRGLVAAVRDQAAARHGLAPEALLLHCTHTHTGPATMPLYGCGMPSEGYPRELRRKLVDVVGAALANRAAVTHARRFETDFPEGFAHNRVGGSALDTHVRGLRIDVDGARPIVVVSYACHPVTLGVGWEYSADYCGALVREFNAYGVRALYLNGCCGDVNPLSNAVAWGSGTRETLLIYGRDLAAAARRGMQQVVPWQTGPVRCSSRMVPLQPAPTSEQALASELEQLQQHLEGTPDDHVARVDVRWHELQLELHRSGRLGEEMAAEVQAISCGDVVLVGLSGEVFTALGQTIRAAAPGHLSLIAATSNGVRGYIATREDVEGGGYASSSAAKIYGMPLPAPGAGEKWAEDGCEVVEAVTQR